MVVGRVRRRRGGGGTEIAPGLERMPIDLQRGMQCNKELL